MLKLPKKPLGGVYKIYIEGVGSYYGESNNIPARWARHRKQLNNRRHANHKLKAAWNSPEIGPKKFNFIIIEQSERLTENKDLRLYIEKMCILQDPSNLNIVHGVNESCTAVKLPDRQIYRNRIVWLKRHHRSSLVKVCNEAGQLLGNEYCDFKFRLGKFRTDSDCNLTRIVERKRS